MANNSVEKIIAQTFMDIANGLETGSFGRRPKMAVTALGSEHGEENVLKAAVMAANRGVDVTLIGTAEHELITTAKVADEDEGHKKMEALLTSGEIDGVVTMHYPFPIGVSTVGRVVSFNPRTQVWCDLKAKPLTAVAFCFNPRTQVWCDYISP